MQLNDTGNYKRILLIDDDRLYTELIKEVVAECKLPIHLTIRNDGQSALQFLRWNTLKNNLPKPDLILLDMNLLGETGLDVLAELKTDKLLRLIPIVMLSGTSDERDYYLAYYFYANSFVVKPRTFEEMVKIIERIVDYWFNLCVYPDQVVFQE